jgi:TRAP-type C4-dicarboxylate transport system permease small subunit
MSEEIESLSGKAEGAKKNCVDIVFYYLLAYVLLILTAVVTWQIISRAAGIKNTWTEELSRFVFVWASFLGSAYFVYKKEHIVVDLVKEIPVVYKIAQSIDIILELLLLVTYSVITWGGVIYVTNQGGEISGGLHVPFRVLYYSCPVSFFFMSLFQLINIIKKITNRGEK